MIAAALGAWGVGCGPFPQTQPAADVWEIQGPALIGAFADPNVVDLGNGIYRLYAGAEPESVPGQQPLPIFSATSTDGKTWAQEPGIRLAGAAFPDVVKLPDQTWRMYAQDASVGIISAFSYDGLSWTKEDGVRLDTTNSLGLALTNVAAPSVLRLDDGSYVMVYRGSLDQAYPGEGIPNADTQLFLWATSADGLNWQTQGLAVDSRTDVLQGLADGPDLIKWQDGSIRLYFWGYHGVYMSTFAHNLFSAPQLVLPTSNPQGVAFPPVPPADPSVVQIGETWFMYYGLHTTGIYYATLKS